MNPMYSGHYTFERSANRRLPKQTELEDRKGGFPHSEIAGSKGASASPALIAACHVLHRLSTPRHPSEALQRLIVSQQNPCMDRPVTGKKCHRIRCLVLLARRCLLERDLEPYERRSNSSFTMSMPDDPRVGGKPVCDLEILVEPDGVEPTTSCLQSRRSTN